MKPARGNGWLYERACQAAGGKEAEDIAHTVLFLAAHESKMITGHTRPVDGGFLAW